MLYFKGATKKATKTYSPKQRCQLSVLVFLATTKILGASLPTLYKNLDGTVEQGTLRCTLREMPQAGVLELNKVTYQVVCDDGGTTPTVFYIYMSGDKIKNSEFGV